MSTISEKSPAGKCEDGFPPGGSGVGALIRAFDWSTTSLGPIAGWPAHLKGAVSLMLPRAARCRRGGEEAIQQIKLFMFSL